MNNSMVCIQDILKRMLKAIEQGTFYATEKQLITASQLLGNIFSPTMTRQEVMDELGICDTTLRSKIKAGIIPKGRKIRGMTTHKWNKSDIEGLDILKHKH